MVLRKIYLDRFYIFTVSVADTHVPPFDQSDIKRFIYYFRPPY